MRLFEAIIDANHRAVAGDQSAGLHPADFERELPVVALTCIDVRLNALLPEVLGVPKDQFIWLRNAGNIITGPQSSTMRSLALACAIKGGREIAIIGHTDCQVGKTDTMALMDQFRALGVERNLLPANVNEFFGMFASERSNVLKAAEFVRQSPLIGPKIPVHGLLVDIETGKVEWLVNGYQTLETMGTRPGEATRAAGPVLDALKSLTDFEIGGIKVPETKVGEVVTKAEDWLIEKVQEKTGVEVPRVLVAKAEDWIAGKMRPKEGKPPPTVRPGVPPKIPAPPPLRPKLRFQKKTK